MKQQYYYDPKHGGCLRVITKEGPKQFRIKGAYGSDEKETGYWFANIEEIDMIEKNETKYNLIVDFSEKKEITHSKKLYARKDRRKIYWEDGNIWKQLYF
jgi:hypothetical protein